MIYLLECMEGLKQIMSTTKPHGEYCKGLMMMISKHTANYAVINITTYQFGKSSLYGISL